MIVSDDRVARFVSDRLGFALCPPFTAMGIERDGQIASGVVFNHFEGADVHCSIAGTGWTKAFLQAVGTYVFDQLQCERMTSVTERHEIVELASRLGGQVEGVMRNHFGKGRDGILLGILREDWKYGMPQATQHG